jgi:hypothetical protein
VNGTKRRGEERREEKKRRERLLILRVVRIEGRKEQRNYRH